MSNKQIFLTLLLGQLFSWLGIFLGENLNAPYIFPFLFGISVPLANWNSVNYKKWRSTLTLGLISTALFFGSAILAVGLGNVHLIISFAAVGLSGIGFLLFNSAFISSIQVNYLTGTVTFVLVAISLPIGKEVLQLIDRQDTIYLLLFSTFMTTLGLCSSKLTAEQMN
ncbi:hypothetical protein [Tunicatimonas pelagia]|uniref:hypothetical protein n=1 Tax=Tunicatimonas pelagia TaxID=931531 RepID=UPI002665172D|nr:hypothetical protein [Tunicatimonas pelagia]WKN40618.1 hypothetical protein P0M28_16390 [Tunicatimonas pelagia]